MTISPLTALGQSSGTGGDLPPRVSEPKSIELFGVGNHAPLVVYPDIDFDGPCLAEQVISALQAFQGNSAVSASSAQIDQTEYTRRTVILLGNILTNPEILWLYALGQTFVDAAYPGGSGYVIQHVYDPLGAGRNVLIIGASSHEGLRRGVARFVVEVARLGMPQWHPCLLVDSDLDIVKQPPEHLGDDAFQRLRDDVLIRMRTGHMWREIYAAIHAAQHFILSGCKTYLQHFHAHLLAHRDFTAIGDDQFYGGLEFWMPTYIQVWDCVEHSDYWTKEQRRETIVFFMRLMEILESRYHTFERWPAGCPRPRWNHETFPALSYFFMSEYLRRCHPGAAPMARWAQTARLVLGDQTRFIRGTDEAYGYLPYSPSHAVRYALCIRDHGFFTSGRAAELGRLLHMLTDNTGRFLGAGTQEHRDMAHFCLLPVATALRDGRLLGVNDKTRRAAAHPAEPLEDWGPMMTRFGEFRPSLLPATPAGGPQLQVFPLEEGLYRLTNTESIGPYKPVTPVAVVWGKTFDKLAFRRGYENTGEYLLIDGFGRGRHLRMDTNAIVRFTANDRIFLVETDNDKTVAEKFHNMITVIRDGRGSGHVPPYAELQAAVDLGHTAFSRSCVPGYGNVDWTRNVVWLKENLFAVLDQVVANAAGNYILRCHWNGLGRATIAGSALILEQAGQSCAIVHAGDLSWNIADDVEGAQKLWDDYPHAEAVIRRCRQTCTQIMQPGEQVTIGNVIQAYPTQHPRALSARAVGNAAMLVVEDNFQALVFADPQDIPAPIKTDAMLGIITGERIALVDVHTLMADGMAVLCCETPVHVELDLSSGRATFSTATGGTVRLVGLHEPVTLGKGRFEITWAPPEELQNAVLTSLDLAGRVSAAPRDTHRHRSAKKATVTEIRLNRPLHCALFPPTGTSGDIIIGDAEGCEAMRFCDDGARLSLWRMTTSAPATALTWAKGKEPDSGRLICGTSDGTVIAICPDGTLAWRCRMQGDNDLARCVASLAAGNVMGSGADEIAVGSMSWNLSLLDCEGQIMWTQPAYAHAISALAIADIDADGRGEILVGTNYYTLSAFNATGQVMLGYRAQPLFRQLVPTLFDPTIGVTVLAANDADVLAVDIIPGKALPQQNIKGGAMPDAGRERFRFPTGDDVHAIEVADLDGDGKREIIAGSESGFVYCFCPKGELRQVRALDGAVRCLAVGTAQSGAPVVVAGLGTGGLLVLDAGLQPIAEASLQEACKWVAAPTAGRLLCATTQSIAQVCWQG